MSSTATASMATETAMMVLGKFRTRSKLCWYQRSSRSIRRSLTDFLCEIFLLMNRALIIGM